MIKEQHIFYPSIPENQLEGFIGREYELAQLENHLIKEKLFIYQEMSVLAKPLFGMSFLQRTKIISKIKSKYCIYIR